MSELVVTGLRDGKPTVLRWIEGQVYGEPEAVDELMGIVDTREGEPLEAHPEGGGAPLGLRSYESAYLTMPLVLDWVHEVIGEDPFPEAGDPDTNEEMDREYAGKWTPRLHPRWPKGTPGKGGKFMTVGEIAAARRESAATERAKPEITRPRRKSPPIPIPKDPASKDAIETKDPREAARLLAQGKAVRLKQPRQVAVLLDELSKIVKDAEARGEKAPDYDLCKVMVRNTSLFCVESKGIPRVQMPQLKGIPEKGSVADRMEKDKKGEVDLTPKFLDHLRRGGFKTTATTEHAAYLRPSQNELNGAKVAGMVKWMRGGGDPNTGSSLIVSEDNYIVDGHHRWAATVALDSEDNRLGNDKQIEVTRVDIDIIKLLREAVLFANAQGIPNAGFLTENPANK